MQRLDPDEGIRVNSVIDGSKRFTFITKKDDRYTVNTAERVYDKLLKAHIPGGEETWFHTSEIEEVLTRVIKEAERPLRAYLY